MASDFPTAILRPDVPRRPIFAVSEVAPRAKLDQNENPVGPPDDIRSSILEALRKVAWNRYPDPAAYREVKARFGAVIGQPPERLLLTAGADQLILVAFQAAGGTGRRARIFEPTYPIYAAHARTTQTELDRVVIGPDYDLVAHGLGGPVDILILVCPNNPTGRGAERELVREALRRPQLVLVDEAYADYAGESVIDLVPSHPNLLVVRSLSKALVAGVRLGYGVGHPELIMILEAILFAPYHLNVLQLATAASFESLWPHVCRRVAAVVIERGRVEACLRQLGVCFWPSQGNFVLFSPPDASSTYQRLLDAGVRVRDVSSLPGLDEHLRVTIGAAAENDLFLDALAATLR